MNKYNKIVEKLSNLSDSEHIIEKKRYMDERDDLKIYPEMRHLLRMYDDFVEFDNKMQVLESSASWVCLDYLSDWLIDRTRKTSAEGALNEVLEYTRNDSFKANYKLWLSGIRVDTEMEISDNIKIQPVFSFRKINNDGYGNEMPIKTPTACITYSYIHDKIKYSTSEELDNRQIYHEIDRLLLSMLLIRKGLSVFTFAHSIEVNEVTPNFVDYGFRSSHITKSYFGPPLIQLEVNKINTFLCQIKTLTPEKEKEIFFLLALLNQYCSEFDIVIKAVHLRTLLEAVYIKGRSIYIAKDLKKNIMTNSGLAGKEKTSLGDTVIKLYDICSQAVHTANLTSDELKSYLKYEDVILHYVYNDLMKLVEGKSLKRKITVSSVIDI